MLRNFWNDFTPLWIHKKGKSRAYAFLTQTFVDRHANFLPSFFQFLQKSEQKKRSSVKPTEEFTVDMVFCYQNCYDLLWEKNVLVIEKNIWNSRLKAENLKNFQDHPNNLLESSYIQRRPQNFAKSSPYFWLEYIQSKVRGRFRKILWRSQNIWTLKAVLVLSTIF